MKIKKLKLARSTLRWGLGLMLSGFGLLIALVALKASPVTDPVAFWEIIMQIGFIAGILGTLMVLLVSLSFIPGAVRLAWNHSQQHLKIHGKSYITAIYAIGAGLSAMTLAMLKAYVTVFGGTFDEDDSEGMWSGNEDSAWSEDEATAAGVGSTEWWDRYG